MNLDKALQNRMLGSFLGGITGDAYGSYAEFKERDSYEISRNMETTVFGLPPGSFTDDSSMMLCLAASLSETGKFSPKDQMTKYAEWRRNGYMSSCEARGCFDIGGTTSKAISRFVYAQEQWERNGNDDGLFEDYHGLDGEFDAGNGGIMRLAPVPIFFHHDIQLARKYSALSSKVTHASPECLESATVMGEVIALLLRGKTKDEVMDLLGAKETISRLQCPRVVDICRSDYRRKSRDQIKTTGYVIDSLEAALWAFDGTDTFEKGMILLGGCGGDADTVCCIFGQIAGAYYGYKAIPKRWVDALQRRDLLARTAIDLLQVAAMRNSS